jgi:hypothetical protein
MKTLKFSIKAKTVECYLYGGYLFLFMADGRILYLPYRNVIYTLCENHPRFEKLLKLSFLHNEYYNSKAAQMLFGMEEVKKALEGLWTRASKEESFELDFSDIEPVCLSMGKWKELPLDVCMYGMKMFVADRSGMVASRLNPDFNQDYIPLNPSKFEKCFDTKTISVTARGGKVVLSADQNGLFYGDALGMEKLRIKDRDNITGRSVRTGWSNMDLINYDSPNSFSYLQNEVGEINEKNDNSRFRFDVREQKVITKFADSVVKSNELLMNRVNISPEDIRYCFNSQKNSFFILKDGSFVHVNILKNDDQQGVRYSTKVNRFQPSASWGKQKPMKSAVVPEGCVVEYYDKVVLYQKGIAYLLEDLPSYNIRTYLGSRNYRNMVSVIKEDSLTFHSVDVFATFKSQPVFAH